MTMKLYDWQEEAPKLWNANGRCGIIKAVPGAGKTRAAIEIINYIRAETPDAKIMVLCPTTTLVAQWKSMNLNISVGTYFEGAKYSDQKVDLLILDECHSVQSPVRKKSLEINYEHILGLSATPEESDKLIGKIFIDVNWENANISPFKMHYTKFDMDNKQSQKYQELSNKVKWAVSAYNNDEIQYDQYMSIIMNRRSFVYELKQRITLTLNLIEKHKNERIVIFSERLNQLRLLAEELTKNNTEFTVHTSYEQDELPNFISHKTNILLTSKMIKEGFDDPTITTGIIMSTPLSERNHIQTIGRMVRQYPGKTANIYVLLAKNTTDEKLGAKSTVFGTRYSLDTSGGIFIKQNGQRMYAITPDTELLNILKSKHSGRFWINSQGEVHTKINDVVQLLGVWNGRLDFNKEE